MSDAKPAYVTFSFIKDHYDMVAAQSLFDSIRAKIKESTDFEVVSVRARESLNTKHWFVTDVISKETPNTAPFLDGLHTAILSVIQEHEAREEGGVIHIGAPLQ